jgi:glycine oxidase
VVVGAGIIGCAVAYELSRRGAAVDIVDDRQAGMGATQASAGVLAPYIEAHDKHSAFLEMAVRSLNMYDDFVSHVVADSGMPVAYARTGTFEVAVNAEQIAALQRTAAHLEAERVPFRLLESGDVRAEEPHLTADAIGGLLIGGHGFVQAGELARALFAAARRHGAAFVQAGRVRRIVHRTREVIVETNHRSLVGRAGIIAAGSWSGEIEVEGIRVRLPVRPVRGQLLHLSWKGSPLGRVVWADRCYLVPWHDGTLLVGATTEEAGFDERATAAGVRDLLEAACELVPQIWTAGFLRARVGLRPASPDELPIIGPSRVAPNLMYATGHYRNGVLLAPLTANVIADALLEQRLDPMLQVTGPARFGDL